MAKDDKSDMTVSDENRSLWQRLVDAVFGYDYFISYAWADGHVYATKLDESLRNSGFECFLDSSEYRAGDDWRKIGKWTLKRTSSLILVGSPNALNSEPVSYELQTFQRFNNRIVPIDFDGTLNPRKDDNPLLSLLPQDIIRLKASRVCLETGPSDATIRRLHDDFKGIKQTQWRTRLLLGASLIFACIAVIAVWMYRRAETARSEERRQNIINVSQKLTAEAINEAGQLEFERAALLARQAFLLNKRHLGDGIARVDYALRSVLTSLNFNRLLSPNFNSLKDSTQTRMWIRSIAYAPKTDLAALAVDIAADRKDIVAEESEVGIVRVQEAGLTWRPLRHPPLTMPALAMSPDGKKLDAPPLIHKFSSPLSVAFTSDGRTLIAGNGLGQVYMWAANQLDAPPISVSAHSDEIRALVAVPMDYRFITGSRDGTVRLWDPYSESEASFIWSSSGVIRPVGLTIRRDEWLAYNMISQSGVSRSGDGKLYLHQDLGRDERVTPLGVAASSAAFSATGRFLAVGLPFEDYEDDEDFPEVRSESVHSVMIWDLRNFSTPTKMEWEDSTRRVSAGCTRAESLDSGRVELHQASEPPGEPAILEVPDSRSATSLAFNPEGTYVLTMSKPSTRFNVSRTLRLYVSATAALAEEVCSKVRRNLTQEEWRRFVGPSVLYERTCPNLPAGP
jgi:hypothetical protein